MSAIDAHLDRQRLLARACGRPMTPHIEAEYLTNIHPKDGPGWRILLLRVIIRDSGSSSASWLVPYEAGVP